MVSILSCHACQREVDSVRREVEGRGKCAGRVAIGACAAVVYPPGSDGGVFFVEKIQSLASNFASAFTLH